MHSPTSSHQQRKPSSAERFKIRVKLAQEYGHGQKATISREVRTAPSKANGGVRGYRTESYRYGVDILCHMCSRNLQLADSSSKFDYLEMDRVNPGAEYSMPNLLPACRSCNASRGDYLLPDAHVKRYRAQYGKGGKFFDHRS